jgi:hypothetical protein
MKRILYREFYIAKDSQKVTSNKFSEETAVCYISASATGRVSVQFFTGNKVKPDKYLAFKSRDSANTAIEEFFENMLQVIEYKEQQKQKQKAARKAAKRMLPGLSGGFETLAKVAIENERYCGLDKVSLDIYEKMLRKLPGMKIGHIINGEVSWE